MPSVATSPIERALSEPSLAFTYAPAPALVLAAAGGAGLAAFG